MPNIYELMGPGLNTRHIDMNVIKSGGNVPEASYYPMKGDPIPSGNGQMTLNKSSYEGILDREAVGSSIPRYEKKFNEAIEKAFSKMSPQEIVEFQDFSRMYPDADDATLLINFLEQKRNIPTNNQ